MGNSQCAPRAYGENVKDFLLCKFGRVSRKRKIDDLVMLAIQDEGKKFKNVAGGMKLTKQELARYHEERDNLVDEFNDNVMEIEMCNLGNETPSNCCDSDESYSSDSSETLSSSPESSPESLVVTYPESQRLLEEYCKLKVDIKELDLVSLSGLPEWEQYKNMADKRTSYIEQYNKTTDKDTCLGKDKSNHRDTNIQVRVAGNKFEAQKKMDKVALEIGGGERLKSDDCKHAQIAYNSSFENGRIDNGKMYHISARTENGVATHVRPASQNTNKRPRYLEKSTEGLRQRQTFQSRVKPKVAKRGIDKGDSVSGEFSLSCATATEEHLEKDLELEVNTNKNAERKIGFFGRVAEKLRHRSSSRLSPNSIIHVKPATSTTEFMPP